MNYSLFLGGSKSGRDADEVKGKFGNMLRLIYKKRASPIVSVFSSAVLTHFSRLSIRFYSEGFPMSNVSLVSSLVLYVRIAVHPKLVSYFKRRQLHFRWCMNSEDKVPVFEQWMDCPEIGIIWLLIWDLRIELWSHISDREISYLWSGQRTFSASLLEQSSGNTFSSIVTSNRSKIITMHRRPA